VRILITGNLGYIGPVVVSHLRSVLPNAELAGFDAGWFAHCLAGPIRLPETGLDVQYFEDLREFPDGILDGIDTVVNLAAVSNDPMGKRFEAVTAEINHAAGMELAKRAKKAGVRRFVFASSCSVYGWAEDGARTERSTTAPETAYARSKVDTENDLAKLAGPDFQVTCLRFATACGMSPRLRLDLVLNDFVAAALTAKKITVLSDGTPWRPLIHVRDMARAIEWAAQRMDGGDCLIVNTGCDNWNHQVRDLAEAVAKAIPGTAVDINTDAAPDRRSYRVDFSLFKELAPSHQPHITLPAAITDLEAGLRGMDFAEANFRESNWMRLNVLAGHVERGALSPGLRWQSEVKVG